MSDLPLGWTDAEIGDVAAYVSRGRSPKYVAESSLPVINQRCVRWDGIDERHLKFVDPATRHQWSEDRFLRVNDILWNSTGTGTIGRAAIFRGLQDYPEAVADSHITVIRSNDAVDPAYLFNFIRSPAMQNNIVNMQSGSTNQVELNRREIVSAKIPLAPLLEQRRIVGKLDGILAHTARAQKELDRVPVLVSRYKKRLLELAFSGELTSDWRDKNGVPTGTEVELREVAEDFSYGSSKKSSREGRVPVLRMGNIKDGELDWSDLVYTSSPDEIEKYRLRPGDVLFNRTNSPALVGKTALFTGERDAIYAGYLIRVRCGPKLMPAFLSYCLNSPLGRAYSWRVKSDSVGQSNINAKKLAAFRFVLPSLEEQKEIVHRVDLSLAWLHRLTSDQDRARKSIPKLDAAILSRAFQGKLVPQDPGEESARTSVGRTGKGSSRDANYPRRGQTPPAVPPTVIEDIVPPYKPTPRKSPMSKSRQDEDVKGKPYLAGKLKTLRLANVQELFSVAGLPVADFYKQLTWEIDQGYIKDNKDGLRAA